MSVSTGSLSCEIQDFFGSQSFLEYQSSITKSDPTSDVTSKNLSSLINMSFASKGEDKTSLSVYSFDMPVPSYQQMMSIDTAVHYGQSVRTKTSSPNEYVNNVPLFSQTWQFSAVITSQGGTLQGQQSDVRVVIPSKAVEKNCNVLALGAICTDLETVHTYFKLPEEEYIASPVAEYFAEPDFPFQTPVRIILPHFLHPNFSEDSVKVYQCYRSESGDWIVETLPMEDKKNLQQSSIQTGHSQRRGIFCFAENREIHILTNHFSVYWCTDCKTNYSSPELFLKVYAKHTEETCDERQVDIRLDIWDSRLRIQDFPNVCT